VNDTTTSAGKSRATTRRTFLGAVGVLAGWAGLTAMAPARATGRPRTRPNTRGLAWTRVASSPEARAALQTYPLPTYLPEGYRVTSAQVGLPQGFRNGQTELALICHSPAGQPHVPLVVFITQGAALYTGACDRGSSQAAQVTLADASIANASYYDGMWAADRNGVILEGRTIPVRWTTAYLHSLILSLGAFTVGVQAPVPSNLGVSRAELARVAGSVAFL
jgi:hypothetical protein